MIAFFLALFRKQTLDLSNNDLSDLPCELGVMPTLDRLVLEGNPMRKIRRGTGRINTSLVDSLCLVWEC